MALARPRLDLLDPRRRIGAKLALGFVALALPALLLVQALVVAYEYAELESRLRKGALREALLRVAGERPAPELAQLQILRRRLIDPAEGLGGASSRVLLELSARPLELTVLGLDGGVRAATAELNLPARVTPGSASGDVWVEVAGGIEQYAWVPLHDASGRRVGTLVARLRVPSPLQRFGRILAFEWPIVALSLAVFAAAAATLFGRLVAARLRRVADAAERWARGDFAQPIGDRRGDELGLLSQRLDRMAAELAGHVETRATLASLAERERMARDLHDTVKQKLFALGLQLDAAARSEAQREARLADARALVEEAQRALAALLGGSRDEIEPNADFGARLRDVARDWSARSGIGVTWSRCDDGTPPPAVRAELAGIFEEALSNVWRHSGARQVRLSLRLESGAGELEISDDGRGIAAAAQGMGLKSLQARGAALPGGALRLDTPPGGGTRVGVRWRHQEAG